MDEIFYSSDLSSVTSDALEGFFEGWTIRPTSDTLLRLLNASPVRVLAMDSTNGKCIGYVTALTDGVLFGYVSSLEVLPEYQGRGIGKSLMGRVLDQLQDLYAVDLVCDEDVQPFYEKCGLKRCFSMVVRRPNLIGAIDVGSDRQN